MVISPIWKDVSYTSSTTPLKYSIYIDDMEIFNGIAYARPNTDYVVFNINKICQNWLGSVLPDIRTYTGTYTHENAFRTFVLKDESGNTLETYKFLYDWSYDDYFTGQTCSLNRDINGKNAYGQVLFQTNFNTSSVTTTVTHAAGNTCGEYALYYLNRYGGWDSFLIEGNIIKTDNYTKLNWRRKGEYNQGYSINALKYIDEKVTDSVNIDTTYQAYTGWLSDEEAERLVFHLLSSPKVFFQDLNRENKLYNTDDIFANIPIRITSSSAEYKKFRNGRRLVNYSIKFEKGNIEKVRN